MNKFILLIFTHIFYPFNTFIDVKYKFYKILSILIFIIITYYLKFFIFKINLLKKSYASFTDRIKDFFPILATIFLSIAALLALQYIKEVYGDISLILSICYVILTLLSYLKIKYISVKNRNVMLYALLLFCEYFLVTLIPFDFNTQGKNELLTLYFSFTGSLVSLKLLDNIIIKKIPSDYAVKIFKNKTIHIFSIILILLCLYPITLSILATTFFHNRNLILVPFIIIIYLSLLKKFFSAKSIKYIKSIRVLILIFPLIMLYITKLFF